MGTGQTLKTKSEVRGKGLQIMGQFLSRHLSDPETRQMNLNIWENLLTAISD